MHYALSIFQRVAQIHKAAAFGKNRHPFMHGIPNTLAHRNIGREHCGVFFRVSAAQYQTGYADRQAFLLQR